MSSQQQLTLCIEALHDRIASTLMGRPAKQSGDKFLKSIAEDSIQSQLEEYVREPELKLMLVWQETPDRLSITFQPTTNIKKKGIYFLKNQQIVDALKPEDFTTYVTTGEIQDQTLNNLHLIASEVYFPLLQNPQNRQGWSQPTSKDVLLKFSSFLSELSVMRGQIRGQTLLPYPPVEAFDEDNLVEKERIHLLESCVLQWSQKIHNVLNTDPQQQLDTLKQELQAKNKQWLKQQKLAQLNGGAAKVEVVAADGSAAGESNAAAATEQDANDGPEAEIEFWQHKSQDLNSLLQQLSSDKMKAVIDLLHEFKSSFAGQITKLTAEVETARNEAMENSRFLKTLQPYFGRLSDEVDFPRLKSVFVPLMHTILLVFTHSRTYNTKQRLSCLLEEICNSLVRKAQQHISGETIFRLIEDENVFESITLLRQTSDICQYLKLVFTTYQQKALQVLGQEGGQSWAVNVDQVFYRLHAFLDRCNDMLEFSRIVYEFNKLEKIYISGTKGKSYTQALRQVHSEFQRAVDRFKGSGYDAMDVSRAQFDDDYYAWRCAVKELERRVAAVLLQAFDDQSTLMARFKLLDSFEGK